MFATTLKKYRSYTNRFLEFIDKNFPHSSKDISNLRFIYVIEFLNRARQKEYFTNTWSDKNCNGARAVLQMIFDYAIKRNYITENPLKEIKPFPIPERTTGRVIQNADLKKIFKNLPKHWVDIFKFLLYTGLRNSELTYLTWTNFHQNKKRKKLLILY